MKKFLFIFCFSAILLAPFSIAQQKTNAQEDSIVAILPQLRDSAKLEAMVELATLTDGESIRKYYVDMLLDEARRQKHVRCEGRALTWLVEWYGTQFSDSVFLAAEEAIRFTREHKLYDLLFLSHHMLATSYVDKGLLHTAIRKAEEAYAEAKELQDNLPTARMLAVLGLIYNELGLYKEALRYYEESLRMATLKRQPDTYLYIQNYDHLATLSGVLNRFDEVLRYADSLHVELERFGQNNPTAGLQIFYFQETYHRAVAHAKLKQPEQALQAIKRAEALFEPQWNGTFFEILIDEAYIIYFLAAKSYDEALVHIRKALQFYEDNQLESNLLQKQKTKASVYFEKGNYKISAEIYRDVIQRIDSLNQNQFYEQINELRTLYELDKAEMEAERRQEAIRRQRLMITGLALACLGLLAIAGIFVWNRRKIMEKNRALYRQIKEQDRLAEELKQTFHYDASDKSIPHPAGTKMPDVVPLQNGDARQRQLVAQLNEYLFCNQNFARQDIDTAKLAASLATNRTSLFVAVKSITGKTLQEYINIMKMNNARQLLETSPESLDIIIEMCGFASKSTFYRLFREHYNMPPVEYRKIAIKNKMKEVIDK